MNNTNIELKEKLIGLLKLCTKKQVDIFKRMYSHNNLDASIEDVVEKMESHKLEWAIHQTENTLNYKYF